MLLLSERGKDLGNSGKKWGRDGEDTESTVRNGIRHGGGYGKHEEGYGKCGGVLAHAKMGVGVPGGVLARSTEQ